jgi:hypothetical protein
MGYDLSAFETQVGQWLTGTLPTAYANRVVAADTRAVALSPPLATFKIVEETTLNPVPQSYIDNNNVESIKLSTRCLLSVNLYGPQAYSDAVNLVLQYGRFGRATDAAERGFTVASHTGIRRIVESTGQDDFQRAQIDFTLYRKPTITVANVPTVADVEGSYNDDN